MKRKEVLIAVIGGCIGAVLTMFVGLFTPVGVRAQSQSTDAVFGKITCRKLEVVDEHGKSKVALYTQEHGGRVTVTGKIGLASMRTDDRGGAFLIVGRTGWLDMFTNDYGGRVRVWGKGGASMEINEEGGTFSSWDKNRHSFERLRYTRMTKEDNTDE